jgi:hypothetical protein
MRAMVQRPGGWAVAIAVAAARMAVIAVIAATARPAAAQRVIVQGDATVNLGYTQTTRGAVAADPSAQSADIPASSIGGFYTELRPGIAIQTGSPRLTWRATYQFSGNLTLTGDALNSYSNQASAALAAELSKYSLLTLSASVAQGGTSFLLSGRSADTGSPDLRAPGNPDLISATLVEAYSWEIGKHLTLQHSLIGSLSAPQDSFAERNSAVTASLALERPYARDVFGLEARANVSWLSPLRTDLPPYMSYTNALLVRWNHDFSPSWNGLATAGVEQVFTDTGSQPLAFLPTGSLSARYTLGEIVTAVDFTHGTATNLQVGAVSITDRITARGLLVLDPRKSRVVSFSAGFQHNEPLGEVGPLVAAGTGNAVQGDGGFTTAIRPNVLFSVRYSLAYQFGQDGGIEPTLAHIFLVGVTATYKNTNQPTRPLPMRGRRVDRSDAVGFPVVDELPEP